MSWTSGWRSISLLLGLLLGLLSGLAGCAKPKLIPGTQIPDLSKNRQVLDTVERYRRAMEGQNVAQIMGMAHPHYYEHSGTPTGSDDYGYKGLLKVISKRMRQVVSLRYHLKYMRIHWPSKKQAELEVYISASFQLKTEEGERWYRMTDYNRMVLVNERGRWLFIAGM